MAERAGRYESPGCGFPEENVPAGKQDEGPRGPWTMKSALAQSETTSERGEEIFFPARGRMEGLLLVAPCAPGQADCPARPGDGRNCRRQGAVASPAVPRCGLFTGIPHISLSATTTAPGAAGDEVRPARQSCDRGRTISRQPV